jgi:hypothetical protein
MKHRTGDRTTPKVRIMQIHDISDPPLCNKLWRALSHTCKASDSDD